MHRLNNLHGQINILNGELNDLAAAAKSNKILHPTKLKLAESLRPHKPPTFLKSLWEKRGPVSPKLGSRTLPHNAALSAHAISSHEGLSEDGKKTDVDYTESLPDDILRVVLSFAAADLKSVPCYRAVNKRWAGMIDSEEYWEALCKSRWPGKSPQPLAQPLTSRAKAASAWPEGGALAGICLTSLQRDALQAMEPAEYITMVRRLQMPPATTWQKLCIGHHRNQQALEELEGWRVEQQRKQDAQMTIAKARGEAVQRLTHANRARRVREEEALEVRRLIGPLRASRVRRYA
ncbi:hypothetical protein CYMTET_15423 [Cymbomonas tetramitiformis]|uniref:F-box domain-containing protein n=1 Tax=Cymbomonas tetramitiformis TaxID=36881 RepID=A0AAE0GE91_9CHLO|nr:hypothetical protein CYMTET_15423 [Cymbomonas tetramitiformis]